MIKITSKNGEPLSEENSGYIDGIKLTEDVIINENSMTQETKSAKHTKGPWRTDGYYVWADENRMVADFPLFEDEKQDGYLARMRGVGRGITDEEMIANARLMAASPVLLEALEEMLTIIGCDENQYPIIKSKQDKARAAIALARGES